MLRITNTLSGEKEPFAPLDPSRVTMYVCGPTVYADAHIGHAMSYIVFDVVRRYLEYQGYAVNHAQNFTDVDDKIIRRAQQEGAPWDAIAARYADDFLEDMRALNVQPAHNYPRASEVIPEIVEDIAGLIERGHAYPLEGDVYFRVLSDPDYGKLSGRGLGDMQAGARVEVDERKEHPMDFALWKGAKPGEPSWPSPWGLGRPGWHIECTTMAVRTFGPQLDIHGGGADLIFPHHENEIAQSESLTGCAPFARYWMHNGRLRLHGEEMSKSTGNVISIREVVDRYGADAYRWFVLSSHYRRPPSYSEEAVASAARSVRRIALAASVPSAPLREGRPEYLGHRAAFEAAMDDDFNTAQALAVLSDLAKEVNRLSPDSPDRVVAARLLRELTGVLGFALEAEDEATTDAAPFVELLVQVRSELRAAKQWALSDRVRDGLIELGVELKDSPDGTTWRIER